MTKRMKTARWAAILNLAGAMVFSTTAGAAEGPVDFERIVPKPIPGNATSRLQAELNAAAALGNDYLDRSRAMHDKDKLSGGLMILSGFYGALVTAFNPAPKNLKAAILGSGTAAGLNTGLRYRDRSRVYIQGHRALGCVVGAGVPMLSYADEQLKTLEGLRQDAANALKVGDDALAAPVGAAAEARPVGKGLEGKIEALLQSQEAEAKDDRRKVLEERMKTLAELDKALAEEEGAYKGLGGRVGGVRRQIQVVIDQRLAAVAPDYAAVVKAIGQTADPAAAPPPAEGEKAGTLSLSEAEALAQPSIRVALTLVNTAIRNLQAKSPQQARAAFKDMGECVPKAT